MSITFWDTDVSFCFLNFSLAGKVVFFGFLFVCFFQSKNIIFTTKTIPVNLIEYLQCIQDKLLMDGGFLYKICHYSGLE